MAAFVLFVLASVAGFGFVVALLLVASVNSRKRRRARRKQLAVLRHGREDHMAAPEPDHARLLDVFFGPEESSGHLGGPARPAELRGERPSSPADHHQRAEASQARSRPNEPSVRPAAL